MGVFITLALVMVVNIGTCVVMLRIVAGAYNRNTETLARVADMHSEQTDAILYLREMLTRAGMRGGV